MEKGSHPNDGIWWQHWYNNVIETPTGSKNGFVKNTITLKKLYLH